MSNEPHKDEEAALNEEPVAPTEEAAPAPAPNAGSEEPAHAGASTGDADGAPSAPEAPEAAEPLEATEGSEAQPGGDGPASDAASDAAGQAEDAPAPYVRPNPEDVSLKEPALALLIPIALLAIGSMIRPDIFYDNFVYKYYWGPIVNDSGFTAVNTASWAVLMILLLWLLVRIVQKLEQPVTFALIFATVPYMMGGSMTRVFEDTGYFVQPLRYFFITPIIYVVITAVATIWLVIGHVLKKHSKQVGIEGALRALAAFYALIFVVFVVWAQYGTHLAEYGNIFVLFLCMAIPLAYFWNHTRQTGEFSQIGVMAAFGTAFLLYAASLVITWHMGAQWASVAADKVIPPSAGSDMRPWIYVGMFVFPAAFTAIVVWVARAKVENPNFAVYLNPLNLLLIFSQMMDATMTSLGIDVYGYSEKHVLPSFLIGWMRDSGIPFLSEWPASTVMLTAKFAVSLLVVWAIDIYAKRDMEQYPDLVGLAKMSIMMVGLAPGTRDAVRLAMDV